MLSLYNGLKIKIKSNLIQIYHITLEKMVVGKIGVPAVPYSETGYMQRSVTVG